MKVLVVVLNSITGQTLFVANTIAEGFRSSGIPDVHVFVQSLQTNQSNNKSKLENLLQLCSEADLIGFGTPTMCYAASISTIQWLRSDCLPYSCVCGKNCFVFNTFGTHPGRCSLDLALELRKKNAHVIAYHQVLAPDTFAWFSPSFKKKNTSEKPNNYQYCWLKSSLDSCRFFGSQLLHDVTKHRQQEVDIKIGFIGRFLSYFPLSIPRTLVGNISINTSKCTHCHLCISNCPGNALEELSSVVSWNSDNCLGCCNCVTICPHHLISFPHSSEMILPQKLKSPDDFKQIKQVSLFKWSLQFIQMSFRFLWRGVLQMPKSSFFAISSIFFSSKQKTQ